MLQLTKNTFNADGYWVKPIPVEIAFGESIPSPKYVELFDQNGYDLTVLEMLYATANQQPSTLHRYKQTLKQDWFAQDEKIEGAVLNHAYLFERKGYAGDAAAQLENWCLTNPTLYKVLKYRPKWGVDFSMDWIDRSGNVFEILHFEYDGFTFEEVEDVRQEMEKTFLSIDWDDAGKQLLTRKSEWHHLGFFEQSEWKCNYFGIIPERFKMVAWE
jgi:hypothetical protein